MIRVLQALQRVAHVTPLAVARSICQYMYLVGSPLQN
eukprot:COSAG01_NODE_72027_length_254_cov_0.664516_1_plen_36_part_10